MVNLDILKKEKRYSICVEDSKFEVFIFPPEAEHYILVDNMMHTHSFAEVFYCLKGSIRLNLPDNKIILHENDAAIIPCGLTHTKYTDSSEKSVWSAVGLIVSNIKPAGEIVKGLYSETASLIYGDEILICRNNTDFCSALRKIENNSHEDKLSLLELVYNFYKISKDNKTEKLTLPQKRNSKNIDRLIAIDRIFNMEYMYNFSNRQIAERLFLSERQFSRFVLKNYGESFHSLIKKRRLAAAVTMLDETNSSIEEICYYVGFSNKTAFYQYFKKEFGLTPSQYRKKCLDGKL